MPAPTRQSVLDFGLPPPVAARPALLVEQVNAGAGLLFYRAHGLGLDYPLSLRSISSTTLGAPPSSVPGGLAEGVIFYARPTTPDAFQLATAVSPAAPIATFTTTGTGRFGYLVDPGLALDSAIARAWTVVLNDCTAYGGDPGAQILEDAAGALAARLYVAVLCAGDPDKASSYDGIARLYAEIYAPRLEAYFDGLPVRGATVPPATAANLAVAIPTNKGPFHAPVEPFGTLRPFGRELGPRRDRV